MFRNNNSINPGTFTCTGYSSEISDICYTVKQHDKRQYSGLIQFRHKMIKPMICHSRHHCQHALMILTGDTVDAFHGHTLHHNSVGTSQRNQLRRKVSLQIFSYKDFVNFFAGFDSLHNSPEAIDIIVAVHVFILFSIIFVTYSFLLSLGQQASCRRNGRFINVCSSKHSSYRSYSLFIAQKRYAGVGRLLVILFIDPILMCAF